MTVYYMMLFNDFCIISTLFSLQVKPPLKGYTINTAPEGAVSKKVSVHFLFSHGGFISHNLKFIFYYDSLNWGIGCRKLRVKKNM